MEKWQRDFIRKSLPELIDLTLCNTALLSQLCAKDILSDEEFHEINEPRNPKSKAQKLYEIVVKRKNAYHLLLQACKETKQTGVVSILEDGELNQKPINPDACILHPLKNTPAEASSKPHLNISSPPDVAYSIVVNSPEALTFNNKLSKCPKDGFPETDNKPVNIPGPSSSAFLVDQLPTNNVSDIQHSSKKSTFQYSQNLSSNQKEELADSLGNCYIQQSNTNLVDMTAPNTEPNLPVYVSLEKVEETQPELARTKDHPVYEATNKENPTLTVEEWQRLNLPKLTKAIQCNEALLEILVAKKLISHKQRIQNDAAQSQLEKADRLYKIIVTRRNGYEEFLNASCEVYQSGISPISENRGKDLCMQSALDECNVRDFICESAKNIDLSSFHGISSAIAEYVDVEKLQLVLDPALLSLRGPKNETYLHVAAAYGYVKLINCLIDKGLQISTLDGEGNSPGHYVGKFSTNIIKTLQTLLKHGLNLRQTNDNGFSVVSTVLFHRKINQHHYHHLANYIIKIGHGKVFTQECKEGATPFHHALEIMDLERETIDLILNSTKMDINFADNLGRTPLHWALMYGRSLKTIKALIELRADYKMKDGNKEGALHVAVRGSNKKVISFLVSLKLDMNEVDGLGESPLHKVGFTKSRDFFRMTKFLLVVGADLSAKAKNGNNVAHLFALTENISSDDFHVWTNEMINIGHGQIFAVSDRFGRTPLQTAMQRLDLDKNTIQMILESSKVDINQSDEHGNTLLLLASGFGRNLDTIKSLISMGSNMKIKNKDGSGVLHCAVIGGNKEVIQYFISQGLNINEKDNDGSTPLHVVCRTRTKNYFELTKLLLENGADLYSEYNYGYTLAHKMADSEDVSCEDFKIWVTSMIENGHARLFTNPENWGRTLLHCSMERHDLDLETIKLIVESAKLDINQPDFWHITVLHYALECGRSLDTIKSLVELGADWKKKGNYGRSVLHCAVKGSNKEAFLYFKSLGADVNAKDIFGKTPLHCVAWKKNKDFLGMTKFLLENGADLNAKDEKGRTLDQWMSSDISAEEYGVWKEGMIKLGHSSLFQHESFLSRLFRK